MKKETYLPLFSGFYSTIWELQTDNFCYSENCTFEDLEIDYKEYENDVCKHIADFVESNCPFIKSVKFQSVVSPKEYNFTNDSANVLIDYKVKDLAKYMIDNKEALNEFLKSRYTSRSGFISFYDNNFNDWFTDTKGFKDLSLDTHKLGSLLDFYFENECFEEINIYYAFEHSEYEYITILNTNVEDLDDCDKETVALQVFDSLDLDYGYLKTLIEVNQSRADLFNEDIKTFLCREETDFILEASKIQKVNKDLEPIDLF